jgi:hypothetical protein
MTLEENPFGATVKTPKEAKKGAKPAPKQAQIKAEDMMGEHLKQSTNIRMKVTTFKALDNYRADTKANTGQGLSREKTIEKILKDFLTEKGY